MPEQARKLVNEIASQSGKLSFLIQALVKTSRLETGIISVNPQPSSVAELITTSVHAIKTKADEKNITLNIKFNRNIETCFDLKWTEEAMINILDNAVKYTPTGGTISISTTGYELFTRINIEDNGIGIEKGEVNRIFQRFYRSPKVSRYEGVGIGLYLAREIITAGGGYIKVASEPGKGSVFWVFLPNSKEKT
ncbi:Histidine kinase-, DNA gyrase B-, and HSP90-like ATPase [Desulfotomaculum arcticum]|uniref:histidine kinase n=1 Tax=Desulfotruncus arcticus DSM 17038 TaxID=1121424 RepID=A0A1I2WGD4_9FIRM|nr:Histidine kinase-, DNA gyrase B-, and HSP90-like ATPase [Desulfotomaculum arcticum] [Desulfotruncus arcticus DSM 17038]